MINSINNIFKNKKGSFLFMILYFYSISNIKAQEKIVSHSNQQWFQYYNQIKLTNKLTVNTDVGYYLKENFSYKSQIFLRSGVGIKINENVKFVLGGLFGRGYSKNKIIKNELRPYQEIKTSNTNKYFSLGQRFRFEQRFHRKLINDNQLNFSNFRIRYRVQIKIPLILSSKKENCKLILRIGDEIFINAGKKVMYNVFDQNNLLIGLIAKYNSKFEISITYNYLFAGQNIPANYSGDNVIWFEISHKLDFRKK